LSSGLLYDFFAFGADGQLFEFRFLSFLVLGEAFVCVHETLGSAASVDLEMELHEELFGGTVPVGPEFFVVRTVDVT